jgi:hypothetical protein
MAEAPKTPLTGYVDDRGMLHCFWIDLGRAEIGGAESRSRGLGWPAMQVTGPHQHAMTGLVEGL